MFQSDELKQHFEQSSSIHLSSLVLAEWNMNLFENIAQIGNYRYRKLDESSPKYNIIPNSFDFYDEEARYYTGATDADVVIDGGFEDELDEQDNPIPLAFTKPKQKEKTLYSLEDCFSKFRPRSGINKLRYFDNRYSHFSAPEMAQRPRYYMADRADIFKYWSSYRTEEGIERGIANQDVNGIYYIDDAAPYVVYKNQVPANRIVVKMQTNVGSVDFGSFRDFSSSFPDPFFGYDNQTTPIRWKIQYLTNTNNWIDAASFNENSLRRNGDQIIGSDGYVELAYGLLVPDEYLETFFEATTREYTSTDLLPDPNGLQDGTAYLVRSNSNEAGTYFIVSNNQFDSFQARYGWFLYDELVSKNVAFAKQLTSPPVIPGGVGYKEFENVKGLRVVVETMNVFDSTFDLIEMSPRLAVDLSDKTESYSITKPASDLGVSGMPVGQLLASVGSISIFDYDQAFFPENNSSIVKDYILQNIQFKFYEMIHNVNGRDYSVPIKTMYSEGFPSLSSSNRTASFDLRDLFFYLESVTAPQILIQNASLSYAISLLLDNVGFSNYTFKRVDGEADDVIPFFFVEPDKSVAQVLSDLALSTQTAMFFDEYNNFVMMTKDYLMPSEEQRSTDLLLYGSKDFEDVGVAKNQKIDASKPLANIIDISSKENNIFNDGTINYTTRDIRRQFRGVEQANVWDRDKTWIYNVSTIWQITGTEQTQSSNEENGLQTAYVLSAIPLNSDLTNELPRVSGNQVINNVMDFGESAYLMSRYNGYFFANGEIIKYDAVEYSIPGISAIDPTITSDNVWISNVREYQKYFVKMPFNGKMYRTGLVRIYAEPNYEVVQGITQLQNGEVAKHGRGQFGTEVVYHNAGVSAEWLSDNAINGINMKSQYLFDTPGISRTIDNVSLDSNNNFAVFVIPEEYITVVNIGDYVENYSLVGLPVDESINRIPEDTTIVDIDTEYSIIILSNAVVNPSESEPINTIRVTTRIPETEIGVAGADNTTARSSRRTSLIANFLSQDYITELPRPVEIPATIQSSALVFDGPLVGLSRPRDFVSYVAKRLPDNKFVHFGTRMRVIGKIENNETRSQTANNAITMYTESEARIDQLISIAGGSGGISIFVNPENNNGYFFEILALGSDGNSSYEDVLFYKVKKEEGTNSAIPVKLWGGLAGILTDDGKFIGQSRATTEGASTVYDLAIEYEVVGNGLRFYLYLNNNIVAIVDDLDPLPIHNNIGLFVRGSSKCMFENVYALSENYAQNSVFSLETTTNAIFGANNISANDSFRKYAMSGIIQSTYLSGVGAVEPPKYNIYFEEFGTIMREAAYFKVRYDLAYPALLAQIRPNFTKFKNYTVSGFTAGSYGAEFLVFNHTDFIIDIGAQTENQLEIQGVVFTQSSNNELTVDSFFDKRGSLSDPEFIGENLAYSPLKFKEQYKDIKINRLTYGNKSFSINAPYIQSQDAAEDMMSWLVEKIMQKRKSVGVEIFPIPTIQLGDIVEVEYKNENAVEEIAPAGSRFVVYHIEYSRESQGSSMEIYLSEVK